MTDPIADYLTRIRNAYMAGKKVVEIPSSKVKEAISKDDAEKLKKELEEAGATVSLK